MSLIAVVEDEPSISEIVSLYLQRAGYEVKVYADGRSAQEGMSRQMPDLVILDIMLPQVDGFSLTRSLRDRSEVPIIFLTARREESDRIAGLEMGADDYVVKPFSPQELVSRVRAVMRRASKSEKDSHEAPIRYPDLQMDPQTRSVQARGLDIPLTAKEFDMLYHLARHPRQVFSRDQLLQNIWGISDFIDPSTVTVHIRRLREKIETDPANPAHLQTVWGVGYKFEP
jgi:two-component system, OmpR family, response regulator ResD